MKITLMLLIALLVLPTSVPCQDVASTQTKPKGTPDLIITSMAGRDLFQFYCASCHGRDGKGNGYAASALKKAPPDLTTLAERNRGTFPTEMVTDIIKGKKLPGSPAHGSSDMPVWGPIFTGLDDRPAVNESRIENIVKHIESLQPKPKGAPGQQP